MRRATIFIAVILVLGVLLLTGCSQLRTVTVPAQQSTINAVTDTMRLAEYPPVDLQGTVTLPETRTEIDDTASTPALRVQRVEVDRRPDESQVRFLWERGDDTVRDAYEMPVYGEMLVWRPQKTEREGYPVRSQETAGPDTVYWPVPTAELLGGPQDQQVEADVTSEPPWYSRLWTQVRMLLSFVAGAFASYVVVKLVPGL